MLENHMAIAHANDELSGRDEPTADEVKAAEYAVLARLTRVTGASSLYHEDGRSRLMDALAADATALRDIAALVHRRFQFGRPDHTAIGIEIVNCVEAHLRKGPRFQEWVDDEIQEQRETDHEN
ncbi:MAG: hypothetical protein RJQ08_13470 [Salinisphaeraceae bacterium]